MKLIRRLSLFCILALLLAACESIQPNTPTAKTVPTEIVVVTSTLAPTEASTVTSESTATAATTEVATATTTVTATSMATLPDVSASTYLDDRSTAAAVIFSYVNAINRHEYLRAYSYWNSPSSTLGTLDAFSNGFTNVSSESVAFGQITSDGAAGSIYYTVPAVLTDTMNDNSIDKYGACFLLRLPQPGNFGAPPIQPMGIERGVKSAVDASSSDTNVLASACSSPDYSAGGNNEATAVESLSDLSASNYIDNRSGAVEEVSSLLNAINRKEYVRAYSYFQTPATFPGSYSSYAAGFSDTGSVTAIFGTPTVDAGAGQFYYQVGLAMKVITTSNAQQTFVGCYTMHLANPGIQGTVPFQPLGITAGKFKQVTNNIDVTPLIAAACN